MARVSAARSGLAAITMVLVAIPLVASCSAIVGIDDLPGLTDGGDASSPFDSGILTPPPGDDANVSDDASADDAATPPDSGTPVITPPPPVVDASPPAVQCTPQNCLGGTCQSDDTCLFTCSASKSCDPLFPGQAITCPAGIPCQIECTGSQSCNVALNCSKASKCTIECSGSNSCNGGITCGGTGSTLKCKGGDCNNAMVVAPGCTESMMK